MDKNGWVKLHRRWLEWEWHDVPSMVSLFHHLITLANCEDKVWRGRVIMRGQLITTVESLSIMTGLTVKQVRICLEKLAKSGEILKKGTNKYTIVTICNYEHYQQTSEFEGQTSGQSNGQSKDNQRATTKEHKNNIINNILIPSKEEMSVARFFNDEMDAAGAVIPRVHSMSEKSKRASAVRARIREHGEEAVKEMIRKAAKSDFLNGKNQRGWTASFDWLFLPTNFVKVLEGNYDQHATAKTDQQHTDPRMSERQRLVEGYAATIAQLAEEDDRRAQGVRKP